MNKSSVDAKTPEVGRALLSVPDFGEMYLSWSDKGLRELWLPKRWRWEEGEELSPKRKIPSEWRSVLLAYFAGKHDDLNEIPVDPVGTKFQKKVWRALRRIPYGEVRSYGSIARSIGSPQGMRAVGGANGKNPVSVVIPCHRVVQEGNGLGGYTAGLPLKRKLLKIEGVQVKNGKVLPGQLNLI